MGWEGVDQRYGEPEIITPNCGSQDELDLVPAIGSLHLGTRM